MSVRKSYARYRTRRHKDAMVRIPSISSEFNQRHNERFIVAPKRRTTRKKDPFPSPRARGSRSNGRSK